MANLAKTENYKNLANQHSALLAYVKKTALCVCIFQRCRMLVNKFV